MGYLAASTAFARPANTTAYADGDLIANDATAGGGGVVVPFVNLQRSGTAFRVRGGRLIKTALSVTNADFEVDLFSGGIPVPAKGDNEAYFATQAHAGTGSLYYRGTLAFVKTNFMAFTTRAVCYGIPIITSRTSILIGGAPSERKVYFLIRAKAAYTPESGETFSLELDYDPVVDDPSV